MHNMWLNFIPVNRKMFNLLRNSTGKKPIVFIFSNIASVTFRERTKKKSIIWKQCDLFNRIGWINHLFAEFHRDCNLMSWHKLKVFLSLLEFVNTNTHSTHKLRTDYCIVQYIQTRAASFSLHRLNDCFQAIFMLLPRLLEIRKLFSSSIFLVFFLYFFSFFFHLCHDATN